MRALARRLAKLEGGGPVFNLRDFIIGRCTFDQVTMTRETWELLASLADADKDPPVSGRKP